MATNGDALETQDLEESREEYTEGQCPGKLELTAVDLFKSNSHDVLRSEPKVPDSEWTVTNTIDYSHNWHKWRKHYNPLH